jgi:hypothetical protein
VTIYCSIDPESKLYGISFYDSMAISPKVEFETFMEMIQKYMVTNFSHPKIFKIRRNKVKRQFKNTECGMFCLIFLISCHEKHNNERFKEVCKSIKDDDEVVNIRNILYATFN